MWLIVFVTLQFISLIILLVISLMNQLCDCVLLVCTILEGDIGVGGIAVLDHFSCGISRTLIPNCGVAIFSGPAGCVFLAFWAVFS